MLESPLTTECQWADSDSVLVLMFDGGWFQSTLLTVAAENKNWLCCATAVCLWETGHWSKACDLCLFEWLAAWVTEWHIFHLQGSGPGILCCRCLWVHIRISAPRSPNTLLWVNTVSTENICTVFQTRMGEAWSGPKRLGRKLHYITFITLISSVYADGAACAWSREENLQNSLYASASSCKRLCFARFSTFHTN